MPIEYTSGNLLKSDARVLVNTVNCVGVMGKGIALEFKKEFPEVFEYYAWLCKKGGLFPGEAVYYWSRMFGPAIICVATKYHWRDPSKYEWIELGIKNLRNMLLKVGAESVAVPPLGCGNGGLDFKIVKKMIEDGLGDMDCRVILYCP